MSDIYRNEGALMHDNKTVSGFAVLVTDIGGFLSDQRFVARDEFAGDLDWALTFFVGQAFIWRKKQDAIAWAAGWAEENEIKSWSVVEIGIVNVVHEFGKTI